MIVQLKSLLQRKRYMKETQKKLASFERYNSETNEIFIIKEEIAIIEKRHLMIQTILILDIWGLS